MTKAALKGLGYWMIEGPGDSHLTNLMLRALPRACFESIRNHLEFVDLPQHRVIFRADSPIDHLYFINRGLVSLVKTMEDGRAVEVGAVGNQGIVGLVPFFGIRRAMWEYAVRVPGTAFRIDRVTFERSIAQSDAVSALLRRYSHVVVDAFSQTAACNRLHSLRQRCCHWLLIAHDSSRSDSFPLTHESLALALGVQRAGVSIAANSLQKAGLIHYKYGRVTILDRSRLEAEACECYAVMHKQFDELFRQPRRRVAAVNEYRHDHVGAR